MYNLNREQAAKLLWISTRTLDRRIRKWILTYKKKWNKVFLSEKEIKNYLKNWESSNIIYDTTISSSNSEVSKLSINTDDLISKLYKHFDQNFSKYIDMLSEKNRKIEEKNQIIFSLQHKVSELESKLKNSVALPLYKQKQEELILEKENLKIENNVLSEKLQKEKIKNIFLISILVIFVLILIFAISL